MGYVSPIFLREKRNKHRLILNLKELNNSIPKHHFKMDTLKSALNMTRKNCFMASIDLTDAYYSVKVANSSQNFFVFQFRGKFYKYLCLPNGLTSAPRIFTKILKPVLSTLRKLGHNLMNYLDDIFLCGETFDECSKAVLETVKLLTELGFSIHPEKSQFIPVQEIEYLGFVINSKTMKISLTKEKQDGIQNLIEEILKRSKLTIRDISQVLGNFEAALPAVGNGRIYMFYLQKLKNDSLKLSKGNFEAPVKLTAHAVTELHWWKNHVCALQSIFNEPPKLTIFSDACPTGWGAACNNESTGGNWTHEESSFHINVLEMAAAFYALKIYTREVSNCHIQLKVDNTSSLAWINKQTAPNEAVFNIVKEFWLYCISKKLVVSASYINTNLNKVADKESRKLRDNLEWTLESAIFLKIVNTFGPVTIDLFASRINAKVECYYSYTPDPEAYGIDAFSHSWQQDHFYAFPPFSCIAQVINKIELDNATGILIVPLFTTQPWFTRLLRILISEPLLLPKSQNCLYFPYRTKKQPNLPKFQLIACHVSGKSTKTKEFLLKLQTLSCNLGNLVQKRNTVTTKNTGYSFLLNGTRIHCTRI